MDILYKLFLVIGVVALVVIAVLKFNDKIDKL